MSSRLEVQILAVLEIKVTLYFVRDDKGVNMGISDRKGRERAGRESAIIDAARRIADEAGWGAVTIRRLADEIEYSQPVIYSHFANRDAIVAGVALAGFAELTAVLRAARASSVDASDALERVAIAYVEFAIAQPPMYEAMFVLPSALAFAQLDAAAVLHDAFATLASVVSPFFDEVDNATETFWAALHGLVELERHGRIRPGPRIARVKLIVRALVM
jgi:AcrR family transcriptional regulator